MSMPRHTWIVTVQYRIVHLLHSPCENVEHVIASPIAKGDFHGLAAYLFMALNRYLGFRAGGK
ncbi:hypothetical protein [Faecalicatena contorta]|uniref:hypothetical protein n=1 Tax=Faecalicatena contorta TaxID=39482 RepID=UPI000D6C5C18|nr:hypothetical protein [Faecalicatena contorta]